MTPDTPIGPLFTDLYELTMAAGYFEQDLTDEATFSLFIRPHAKRSFFVAAGLVDVLAELQAFRFKAGDLAYLRTTGLFKDAFLDFLESLRFDGTVRAMPEGSLFFADEPVLEITAPIIQAQILETYLLNTIGFQTLIATKAARCRQAAGKRGLVDFALRRTQGHWAGLRTARSAYLAGFEATSNVLAGQHYAIPVSGTMAHSFVMAFADEQAAFEAFAQTFAHQSVFLIDTYDVLEGARRAAEVGLQMQARGHTLRGVRLDSGDMITQSRQVRAILDEAGLHHVKIFASSGFDEYKIETHLEAGARIDAFGVGTRMGVSADAPYLDVVYKLVRFKNHDLRKLSPGKITLAGSKQVFRHHDAEGRFTADTIGLAQETIQRAQPLLTTVMRKGALTIPQPTLSEARERFADNFDRLQTQYRSIHTAQTYPVKISAKLAALQKNKLFLREP